MRYPTAQELCARCVAEFRFTQFGYYAPHASHGCNGPPPPSCPGYRRVGSAHQRGPSPSQLRHSSGPPPWLALGAGAAGWGGTPVRCKQLAAPIGCALTQFDYLVKFNSSRCNGQSCFASQIITFSCCCASNPALLPPCRAVQVKRCPPGAAAGAARGWPVCRGH